MAKKQKHSPRWAEGAIVYQIYPRSFYDSNGDGIGDIPGITQKLDYLKSLGVNAIWLSPFYPSPMADFGYDVADYCNVDPIFGNLDDAKELIKQAHVHDLKVIVDLVPNHTSDEHEWFKQSKQSRDNPYADWYIWHDPKGYDNNGKPVPPNNWIEVLSGEPAWEWVPERGQFYMHSFHIRQPDLNWTNPKVREAIKEVMRFWLDLGADGFRVDAVQFMASDPTLRDEPPNPDYVAGKMMRYAALQHPYNHGWPQMHAYLSEMASVLREDKYRHTGRFMITEAYPDSNDHVQEYLSYYQGMDPAVAAPFIFEGLSLPWDASAWHIFLKKFHETLDEFSPLCVASYAFGNHDQHRIVSRLGEPAARSAAVLLLTLPGMAFIYNGEEIGMSNGDIPLALVQDPGAKGGSGRDPERTPLQWSPGRNAGFSTAERTWLPVADNYKTYNIETESKDPKSFLSLYRHLGKLRNKSDALRGGSFKIIETDDPHVLGYVRKHGKEKYVVFINFSEHSCEFSLSKSPGRQVVSSNPDSKLRAYAKGIVKLHANEAVVFKAGSSKLLRLIRR